MSYKWTSGSVRRGDIYFEDDDTGAATYIDFGEDTITLRPSASAILYAEDDAVGIGTTDPQTTLHVKGDPGQFRVEDTTVDYAYTIDCDGNGIRTHFGDMTAPGDEDAFMSFGAYSGINRLDTAARDFHIYGTNTTVGFYFDESEGAFGFGTTTPTAVLHVSGSDAAALFSVRSDSNIDLFTVTGSGQVGIRTPDPKVALDVHDDPTGLENDTGGGMVIKFGGGTVAKGKLYFLHTDGNWTATDSSAVATGADQLLAISLGTDAAVDGMLIRGFFDADTELDNFSAGKAAYVSETASKMDTTAPTTADAFVRIVGYCTDQSNVIYFNPGTTWIEL